MKRLKKYLLAALLGVSIPTGGIIARALWGDYRLGLFLGFVAAIGLIVLVIRKK